MYNFHGYDDEVKFCLLLKKWIMSWLFSLLKGGSKWFFNHQLSKLLKSRNG